MTDTGPTREPTATAVSFVAPSGGAGAGAEAEMEAGTAMAEANARQQDEALKGRERDELDALKIAGMREAATNKDAAEKAVKIRAMVERQSPPGPGLPMVKAAVIAATMDPNNPVLNPDVSRLDTYRSMPPGARVPAPVLPQDTVQTQFASKPPTEEHAREGEEVAKGLPEPMYPPRGAQPVITLTAEERETLDREGDGAAERGQAPVAGQPAYDPNVYPQRR